VYLTVTGLSLSEVDADCGCITYTEVSLRVENKCSHEQQLWLNLVMKVTLGFVIAKCTKRVCCFEVGNKKIAMTVLIPSWNLLIECTFDPLDIYDISMFIL
jgi:hypothetical protein